MYNILKLGERNLDQPISKIGELAPLGAVLTNVRNSDQTLSFDQLLDEEVQSPKCHLGSVALLQHNAKVLALLKVMCEIH